MKWKQDGFWKECTSPGPDWKLLDPPARYTFTIRANTVIDVSPRDAGNGFPLYRREALKASTAPMTTVQRFVAAKTVQVFPR